MLEDALGLPHTLLSGFSSRQNGLSTENTGVTGFLRGIVGKFSRSSV